MSKSESGCGAIRRKARMVVYIEGWCGGGGGGGRCGLGVAHE